MITRFAILSNHDGKKLVDTLTAKDWEHFHSITKRRGNETKFIQRKFKSVEIFLATEDKDLIKSNKLVKKTFTLLLSLKPSLINLNQTIEAQSNKNVNRLFHNLTNTNAHLIQELYDFIPQEMLTGKPSLKDIKNHISSNIHECAVLLLRTAKYNLSSKTEFSVYKKLFDKKHDLKPRNYTLYKVFTNVSYFFFPDFTDKGIKVITESSFAKIYIDYESLNVALYHILDNCSKYVKENSNILVNFNESDDYIEMTMKMESLLIEGDPEVIFQEGYKCPQAKELSPDSLGIGMFIVSSILKACNADIQISPSDRCNSVAGIKYCKNELLLKFPREKK